MLITRAEAPRQKNMLVLVDFQAELVDMLTYRHGPVSRGIERVEGLIRFCKELEIPIALVTSVNWPDIVPSILNAAGPGAPIFTKRRPSAFSDAGFARFMEMSSPLNLILAGSIRHLCMKSTSIDALERGHGVITTEEVMFGSSDVDSPAAISEAFRFFNLRTKFFPDLYSMEAAMKDMNK